MQGRMFHHTACFNRYLVSLCMALPIRLVTPYLNSSRLPCPAGHVSLYLGAAYGYSRVVDE